ncbi:MAG: hypothetical protein AAFY41_15665, partial [Bacteroidota bacterium]
MNNFFFLAKGALRLIRQSKITFLIDLIGLVVGFCAFKVLYLYTDYEFSYDKYHEKYDRIYRVHRHSTMDTPLTASESSGNSLFKASEYGCAV